MESNISKYKKDIESLVVRGEKLVYGLYNEFSNEFKDLIQKQDKKTRDIIRNCTFKDKYNAWYNESLALVKQLIPERYEDFISYYKQSKRKDVTFETYTVSDYLIGLVVTRGWGEEVFKPSSIIIKFRQQLSIIESLRERFDSSLYEIKELLQADMFDSELDAAKELNKKGFHRAAGAICGVIIEKHLHQVCITRRISISKKNPAINDYNELLKNNNVIDIPTWRLIQRLGDIRNLCDHNKTEEPTKDDIADLINGTDKIIKTIF